MMNKLKKVVCCTIIFTLLNSSFYPLYAFPDFDKTERDIETSIPTSPRRVSDPELEDSQMHTPRAPQASEPDVVSKFVLIPLKTMIGAVSLVRQGVRFALENPGQVMTMGLILQGTRATSTLNLSDLMPLQGFNITGPVGATAGDSVSSAGDFNGDGLSDLIIGAPRANVGGAGNSYIIYGTNSTLSSLNLASLTPLQGFIINSSVAGDYFGCSVSSAGDFNGDGLNDVIIGARGANNSRGKSYVIYGTNSTPSSISLSGLTPNQGFTINGATISDYSGRSVSSAGDFNGDGLGDVIIGADGGGVGGQNYVIYGTNSTPPSISLGSLTPMQGFTMNGATGDYLGWSVSSAGDFNDDGLGDVIMGGFQFNSNRGKIYLIYGTRTPPSSISLGSLTSLQGFNINGFTTGDFFGRSVSSAGDFNDDGLGDVIIGANGANGAAGKSYVIYGTNSTPPSISLTSLTPNQGFTINGVAVNDYSGSSVSSAGDFNGDGLGDVVIGAPYANAAAGKSYVVYGTTSLPSAISLSLLTSLQGFVINSSVANDNFGYSVSSAGDFNGDGLTDVIIGAPRPGGGGEVGKSYVIYGVAAPSPTSTSSSTITGAGTSTTLPTNQMTSANSMSSSILSITSTASIGASTSLASPSSSLPMQSSTASSSETSWQTAAAIGGGIGAAALIGGFGAFAAKKFCCSKGKKPDSFESTDSDVELAEEKAEILASKDIDTPPSSRVTSPFEATSAGFTEHPSFVGKLRDDTYEIWKKLSQKEVERLRPLTAMIIPDVSSSKKIKFNLGKGNFGATYAGRNRDTHEIYAIKEIYGQEAVEESLREGEIVHSLGDYLHIMPLIDYMHFKPHEKTEDPRLLQVMPLAYVNGIGFKEMLEHLNNEQREQVVSDTFGQMMKGLKYIHGKGVVHLDIKADNTLYMKDGTLRIADFGRAKYVGDNDQINDKKNLGAIRKFSPEIIELLRRLENKQKDFSFSGKGADVWAAGLYIWELLEDDVDNLFSLASTKIVPLETRVSQYTYEKFEELVEKVSLLQGTYSPALLNLLRQALTVDPGQRIQPTQVIKKLSSSAMTPDERKTAFEKVIKSRTEVAPASTSTYLSANPAEYMQKSSDQKQPSVYISSDLYAKK